MCKFKKRCFGKCFLWKPDFSKRFLQLNCFDEVFSEVTKRWMRLGFTGGSFEIASLINLVKIFAGLIDPVVGQPGLWLACWSRLDFL